MTDYCQHCTSKGDYALCSETPCHHHEGWVDLVRIGRIKALEEKIESYKTIRAELTQIAAKLVCYQFRHSECEEDYPQKTYSARRVAKIMEGINNEIREIGITLHNVILQGDK